MGLLQRRLRLRGLWRRAARGPPHRVLVASRGVRARRERDQGGRSRLGLHVLPQHAFALHRRLLACGVPRTRFLGPPGGTGGARLKGPDKKWWKRKEGERGQQERFTRAR